MDEQLLISYKYYRNQKEIPTKEWLLIEKAMESCEKAYAPYSSFHVGACVELTNGTIVCGNNQENASCPEGMCAERIALFAASANNPELTIEAIAIISKDSEKIITPCGGCRQVLLEYEQKQNKHIKIILGSVKGQAIVVSKAEDLLPFYFGKENL